MQKTLWVSYLRAFITALVVAHHAMLAYTTFAYFDSGTYINSTNQVVDIHRWVGLDILVSFNDLFFMALMFFISGLFVVPSFIKKGKGLFLKDRLKRLGIPFLISVIFIIPIGYIPSYYLATGSFSLIPFIKDYITHQGWPVGPPWFIWVLLAFNVVVLILPAGFYIWASQLLYKLTKKPFLFVIILLSILSLSYIPISTGIGHYTWTGFGPFDFQLNRIVLYFVWFMLGVILGTGNWQKAFFRRKKLLGSPAPVWVFICLTAFLMVQCVAYFGGSIIAVIPLTETVASGIYGFFMMLSCLCSSLAFVAVFKKWGNKPSSIMDSLSQNAYAIYLLHYPFISWSQFALLGANWPAAVKAAMVFIFSMGMSWVVARVVPARFK